MRRGSIPFFLTIRYSTLSAVRPCGAGMQFAKDLQLTRTRRRWLRDIGCKSYGPSRTGGDLVTRHARMNRTHDHFLGYRIRFENAQIGDQFGRPLGLEPKTRPVIAAFAVPHGGDKVELVREGAFGLRHDDENLPAGTGDFRRTAA